MSRPTTSIWKPAALLAEYLAGKGCGFLLVSHDRAFLDAAVDHVIALNPETVDVQRSDYSTWRGAHLARLAEQARSNALLRKDIARLETRPVAPGGRTSPGGGQDGGRQAAAAVGAGRRQRLHRCPGCPADEAGAGGGAAGRTRRQTGAGQSLTDVEKEYPLMLPEAPAPARCREPLVRARDLRVVGITGCSSRSRFEVRAENAGADGSERLRQVEPAGAALLAGCDAGAAGATGRSTRILPFPVAAQIPRWRRVAPESGSSAAGLDEGRFRQLMAALGVRGAPCSISRSSICPRAS